MNSMTMMLAFISLGSLIAITQEQHYYCQATIYELEAYQKKRYLEEGYEAYRREEEKLKQSSNT